MLGSRSIERSERWQLMANSWIQPEDDEINVWNAQLDGPDCEVSRFYPTLSARGELHCIG